MLPSLATEVGPRQGNQGLLMCTMYSLPCLTRCKGWVVSEPGGLRLCAFPSTLWHTVVRQQQAPLGSEFVRTER